MLEDFRYEYTVPGVGTSGPQGSVEWWRSCSQLSEGIADLGLEGQDCVESRLCCAAGLSHVCESKQVPLDKAGNPHLHPDRWEDPKK